MTTIKTMEILNIIGAFAGLLGGVAGLLALVVSLVTLFLTHEIHRDNKNDSPRFSATTKFAEVEGLIGKIPSVLRFHGIPDPEKALSEHGVTAEELAYLISSFTLAGVLYTTSPDKTLFCGPDSYRDHMFQSEAMRKAWPLVRMFYGRSANEFRDAMDKLCREHSARSTNKPDDGAPKGQNQCSPGQRPG